MKDFNQNEPRPIIQPIVENVLIGASEPGISLKTILVYFLGFILCLSIGIVDSLLSYKSRFPEDMWLRFWIEDATPSGRKKQYLEKIEIEKNRRAKVSTEKDA